MAVVTGGTGYKQVPQGGDLEAAKPAGTTTWRRRCCCVLYKPISLCGSLFVATPLALATASGFYIRQAVKSEDPNKRAEGVVMGTAAFIIACVAAGAVKAVYCSEQALRGPCE